MEPVARSRACVACEHLVGARQEATFGQRSEGLQLVISGFVARYRLLNGGRRQITALILLDELCDIGGLIGCGSPEGFVTLSACTIGEIPRSALFTDQGRRLDWSESAFRTQARNCAIAAEWIVSLGQRSAYEAVAHLSCELWTRLEGVGQSIDRSFAFPLTQVDLSDVLDLTSVHANRTPRDLRNAGFVSAVR